jgi:transcriptional regulator with XRE-family HTH domain
MTFDSKSLKLVRVLRGIRQRDVAEAVGVTELQISRFEQGRRQPSTQTVVKLAAALGVEVSDLMEDDDGE